jgi:hypothetical protein
MDHTFIVPLPRRHGVRFALLLAILLLPLAAQCPNQGSTPVAANWQASPIALGCTAAANWPQWHLFTPAHDAPAPHLGFWPGNARSLPRVLVAWRCTGYLLVPVAPWRVTTMGFVLDRPESPCAPLTP